MFEIGRVYSRRRDIHDRYGGQRQGGISTPDGPYVFLFTGATGIQYGYKDGWDKNGVFIYTGEGQRGDMQFIRGNQAIRRHLSDAKDLLLFESVGKGLCRFLGQFACESWDYRQGPDVDGHLRRLIVFHLIKMEAGQEHDLPQQRTGADASELRAEAYSAAAEASEADPKDAKRRYYQRSRAIRDYVLA